MTFEFIGLIIVSVVLAVVLAAYEQLMRKFRAMKSSQEEIEARARDNAVRIISEARDKAVLILNESKLNAANTQNELDMKLAQVAEKQADVYKEMLQKISKNIENQAAGEITEFKKVLESEVSGSEQNVAKKIEEEYKEAARQIEDYKATKMREFDKNAELVAREFVRLVVGKVLNEDDHRKLIKQALEEARNSHVL